MGLRRRTTVMRESRTKQAAPEPRSVSRPQPPASKHTLAEVLLDAQRSLRELVLSEGLEVFSKMLEDDRTALCGRKNQPQENREAYRHGHDEGQQVLGGRKIRLSKPRVRSVAGQEVELPTWREVSLRSEEHTSELQSQSNLVCRLLLEKKKKS